MTTAGPLAVVALLLAVVTADLGAYLVAAARAQTAADAVAAATIVIADPRGGRPGDPVREAAQVARDNDARVETCRCARGAREVTVEVSVAVHAVAATRLGPRRVTARATSRLVPRR